MSDLSESFEKAKRQEEEMNEVPRQKVPCAWYKEEPKKLRCLTCYFFDCRCKKEPVLADKYEV